MANKFTFQMEINFGGVKLCGNKEDLISSIKCIKGGSTIGFKINDPEVDGTDFCEVLIAAIENLENLHTVMITPDAICCILMTSDASGLRQSLATAVNKRVVKLRVETGSGGIGFNREWISNQVTDSIRGSVSDLIKKM